MVIALVVVGVGIIHFGAYNIAADEKHWGMTTRLIDLMRTKSIERRSRDIQVPRLDDPKLALKGAGQYAEMCMNCHLAPGMKDSPTR